MFDDAAFSLKMLLIYLNDLRSSKNLSSKIVAPDSVFGVHVSAVPAEATPGPFLELRNLVRGLVGYLVLSTARLYKKYIKMFSVKLSATAYS